MCGRRTLRIAFALIIINHLSSSSGSNAVGGVRDTRPNRRQQHHHAVTAATSNGATSAARFEGFGVQQQQPQQQQRKRSARRDAITPSQPPPPPLHEPPRRHSSADRATATTADGNDSGNGNRGAPIRRRTVHRNTMLSPSKGSPLKQHSSGGAGGGGGVDPRLEAKAHEATHHAAVEDGRKMTNGDRKAGKGPGKTLQLVHVMFRHGDRAPEPAEMANFPNYEFANDSWFPVGAGHLTNNGKHRLYKLGKTMRARYGKFLGDLYTNEVSTTYCTDYPRTKASAMMFNAGLWPPTEDQMWSEDEPLAQLWQPVPFLIDPKINSALNSFLRSPCYAYEFTRVLKLPEFQELLRPHEKMVNFLSEKLGLKIENPLHIWAMRSLFISQEAMGRVKPDWITENWEEMTAVGEIAFAALSYNDDLKRMAIGPILKKILTDCQSKAEGVLEPKQRKLFVYSGHDTTVAPLLAAMGGADGFVDEDGNILKSIVPSFGSAVILELHKIDGEYAIKILFNERSEDGSFKPLRLVGCDEFCPLNKYIELTKNIAKDDQGLDNCPEAKQTKSLVERIVKPR